MNVRLTESQKIKILNADDIYTILKNVLMRENSIRRGQEHFWIVGLNNQNKILFIELVALGAQNRVSANPPDVFRMAIYKLATKTILVHNHPSGALEASEADISMTDRMLKVGEIISIKVLDHLIITEKGFFSMADAGIMDKLQKMDTWRLLSKRDRDMKDFKHQLEVESAAKEKTLELAKKMLEKGLSIEDIKEITGLSPAKIKKLS